MGRSRIGRMLCSVGVAALGLTGAAWAEPDNHTLSFNRDIRPILSNKCYPCHGPDSGTRAADLRLDVREDAVQERRGRRPIAPGDSAASELVRRITHADPRDRMPPADFKFTLTDAEIATLTRWIDEGAVYEPHWAYITPERPAVPAVEPAAWVRNPIDAFILRKLNQNGLEPAPEADRRVLVRRLSFDLLGLPPTAEEVDAFLADTAPGAYEALVERMLASPHFGERMAVDWLDQVRYADTNGFHGDEFRSVWPYRDYVIRAFNENKRYNTFTVQQLAGDLLPDATVEDHIASGYNRLNQLTAEGGAQAKEYLAKYASDRIRTTSSVWMGATVGCAECHDHKFDPYTMKDFYSFGAFFADIQEKGVYGAGDNWAPFLPLPTPDQEAELEALDAAIARLTETIETPTDALVAAQAAWESEARDALYRRDNDWTVVRPSAIAAEHGTPLSVLGDLSVRADDVTVATETYDVRVPVNQPQLTGLRLEALPDERYGNRVAPGVGNFVLTGIEAVVHTPGRAPEAAAIARATADYSQSGYEVGLAIDGDPQTGWAVDGQSRKGQAREAVFAFAEPVAAGPGTVLEIRLSHTSSHERHVMGRFRLSVTTVAEPHAFPSLDYPAPVREALLVAPGGRTDAERETLTAHYRSIAPALEPVRALLAEAQAKRQALANEIPTTLVTVAVEPREMRILPRGNWLDESGPVVSPDVPAFLPALDVADRRPTRLDLARWLVDDANPLTARVFVNRLWETYFGTGLSKVLDDLGAQGEWPTHPDLLDWLAVEFRESGWNVKHMVRLIVTSNTYRQSSRMTDELKQADPYNRLLARQARFRLEAEFVRDNALAVSGLLSPKLGGPSVFPYQPDGYWANCNTFRGPLIYTTSEGADQYRRGLYTVWKRSFLHPSMLAFDAPTREECTAERVESNTPLQALVLLNDPSYVEAARVFAGRILTECNGSPAERIDWAFRQVVSRAPRPEEQAVLEDLYATHLADYRADPAAAEALLAVGQAPAVAPADSAEHAAWTSVARVLFNLHEAITRL